MHAELHIESSMAGLADNAVCSHDPRPAQLQSLVSIWLQIFETVYSFLLIIGSLAHAASGEQHFWPNVMLAYTGSMYEIIVSTSGWMARAMTSAHAPLQHG